MNLDYTYTKILNRVWLQKHLCYGLVFNNSMCINQ